MSKGGPATEGGKEVVRWNATRHGMRSPAPVVPGIEAQEDWERHLSGILESLAPEGHLETVLAERVALLSWRLHRVTRYETESIALYQEKAEDDLASRRRFASHVLGAAHPEAVRGNLEDARAKHRLFKRFPKLPDDRRLSAFDADLILWTVAEHTDVAAEGETAPEDLLESISIPGVPDGAEAREDYGGWTAGSVRAGIEAVARATDEDPAELLEVATSEAGRAIIGKEQAAEQVARDLAVMSRERLLPDDKTLEKVARYEAHLSRLLFKSLHEIEAMQTRRAGGSAPLARLDVDGGFPTGEQKLPNELSGDEFGVYERHRVGA
ncbi:MAG: hypothetical protein CYG60_07815 [Actinobacteria bacterium]|nr:MAG: hypothetical protein CYG60_07815 [Actinomycetota bacterium]